MTLKEGIVKAISQKEKNFFVLMDEESAPVGEFGKKEAWFSGWGVCPAKKFDNVSFEWRWNDEEKAEFRNIISDTFKVLPKANQVIIPNPAAPKTADNPPERDTRSETKEFMNACIQDTFDILRNRTDSEREYLHDFIGLLDQVRRTRISIEINRED